MWMDLTGLNPSHLTVGRPRHLHVRPAAVHGIGGAQPLDATMSLQNPEGQPFPAFPAFLAGTWGRQVQFLSEQYRMHPQIALGCLS